MFIQKSTKAKRFYGSVVHVDTQFDGTNNNQLMKINTSNVIQFLEDFFRTSPVKPEEIDYVETYGCGLKVCDILWKNRPIIYYR